MRELIDVRARSLVLYVEAKSALLEWVRQQVAPTGVPIENFTTTYACQIRLTSASARERVSE